MSDAYRALGFRPAALALIAASTLSTLAMAPSALAASSAPAQSAAGQTVTVVLSPSAASGTSAGQPAAAPNIVCTVTLSEYVHYSNPGDDISWHWSWTCNGGAVSLKGSHSLKRDSFTEMTSSVSNSNTSSASENIRYAACVNGNWQGFASGTFTRSGYQSSTFEGASPATDITGCGA
jgi:hypothetical protein